MERIICLGIGYLCGLFQTSYIYGRLNGIDIREHGSGNAGTTNALRTMGKKAGAFTLLGDCLKCVVAVLIVRLLFGGSQPEIIRLLGLYGAAGCILGHNFPINLGFKGGKGIAASVGLLMSFDLRILAICAIVFFVVFFSSHYVSLASLLAYTTFLISLIVMGQCGIFRMAQGALNEMYILAFLLTILTYYQHRKNIVRLLQKTEHKTYLGTTNKTIDKKV
jgi:acyl phosphate:glycerol-3-phosphate acyltransferase